MEFKPCEKCNNGYIYIQSDKETSVKKCECLIFYQKEKLLQIRLEENNITGFNQTYDIKDYVGEDKEDNLIKLSYFVEKFKEKYHNKHLFFYGTNGTQKTTISKYLCKEIIKQGLQATHILADRLIKILLDAERSEEAQSIIESLLDKDLLVIDEFDPPKVCVYASGYQLSFLTSFLKTRLENKKKSTIFISNSEISDKIFLEKFGRTIQNLIERELYDILTFSDIYKREIKKFKVDDLWS